MSRFLFVTWDGGGNVPPAVALAHELVSRGHTVRFLGHATQEAALTAEGLPFVRPQHARPFDSNHDYTPLRMLGLFADTGIGRDLLTAVADEPTDLVVIDALMFGALDAARRAGLPYVVLEHMYDAAYRAGILGGPMGLNLRLRRLAPRRALRDARLRLLMTLPSLDPVSAPGVRQVGPAVRWSPRVESERQTVVIGLSTFGYPEMAAVLQRVVDATAGLDARILVSTGPAVDSGELRAHPGVEVHDWLPHTESLPSASVLVTHGGHGSTMSGLAHDLPVLVVALDSKSDHHVMGRSIESAGAGRMLTRRSTIADLHEALAALLAPGPHRSAAAHLGAEIRATDAVGDGATALTALVSNGATEPGPHVARP